MVFIKKIQGLKKGTQFKYLTLSVFTFSFFLFSWNLNSQDSIPATKDLTQEKELKFQQFFFKALSEKSIGNNQKAIENLESCNQILTNNAAVFFELSAHKSCPSISDTSLGKERFW